LLLRLGVPGAGADACTAKPTQMKGLAPVNKEVLKIKLPRPAEADLSNGAHLMVLEDHRVPSISFQIIMMGAGGYYDPADLPGLADTTASLMDEGTATRRPSKSRRRLDTWRPACRFPQARARKSPR
jgi:hypothetical protein